MTIEVSPALPPNVSVQRYLRGLDFARSFTEDEIKGLAALMHSRRCLAGDIILSEGELGQALFFVYRGTVEVVKRDDSDASQHTINRIEAGGIFGEMSFMDHEPASATVQAATDCEVLWLARYQLRQDDGHTKALYQQLTASVAVAVIRRMRLLSKNHVIALKAEMAQVKLRNEFARFFIITMILFGLASLVQKLISSNLPPTQQMLFSWGFLALTFAPIAWFTYRQRLPLSQFGLTFAGWRRALPESFGLAAGIFSILLVARLVSRQSGDPLFTWGSLHSYSRPETLFFWFAYPLHCFLQEFIGRGVIQGSLRRFMSGGSMWSPILLTSALFGMFHFYVSLTFAVITFVVSVIFGLQYARHGSLAGVTLTHFVLGASSVAFGLN